MQTVSAIKLVYQSNTQSWIVELTVQDGTQHRIPLSGPDHLDAMVRALDGSGEATFDSASGELAFLYPFNLDELFDFHMNTDDEPELLPPPTKRKHRR